MKPRTDKTYTMTLDSNNSDLLEIASDAGITDAVFTVDVNNWGNGREIYLAVEEKYSDYINKSEDINFITNQFLTSNDVDILEN
jgi:hypothetical protein